MPQAKVKASHLVGGYMSYIYLGNNNYEVRLNIFRDSSSATTFNNSIFFYVFKSKNFNPANPTNYIDSITSNTLSNTTGTTVPINYYSPCLPTPPTRPHIVGAYYYGTINLPPIDGGYTIVYQRCCRYGTGTGIININNSGQAGATYMVTIPDSTNGDYKNSSPTFVQPPPIVVIQSQPFNFDAHAVDSDGDTLIYTLFNPLDGASTSGRPSTISNIVWNAGYSVTNQLGGVSAFKIDSTTGKITATPYTGGRLGVGYQVQEFRKGKLLGNVYTDFQYFITPAVIPNITALIPTNDTSTTVAGLTYILACNTRTVQFKNKSTNINPLTTHSWDFGVKNSNADTSYRFEPSFTFPDTGIYYVTYMINPGVGGKCSDTAVIQVRIGGNFHIGDSISPLSGITCFNSWIQFMDTSFSDYPTSIRWSFKDGQYSSSKNTQHIFANPGTYNVQLKVQNTMGCRDSLTTPIIITPKITSVVAPNLNCDSLVHFQPGTLASDYIWNFGDAFSFNNSTTIDTPSHYYTVSGNYTIRLITYPNTGCSDTAYKTIYVSLGLEANYTYNDVCFYDTAKFTNTSKQGAGTITMQVWDFGDGSKKDTTNAIHLSHKYAAGNYNLKLWIASTSGCTDSLVKTIHIHPYPTINALPVDSVRLCYLDTLKLQASGGGSYTWQPNYNIDNINLDTPRISPDVNTLYIVTVTSPYGCVYKDSIKVNVITNIQHSVTNDTAICYGDTIRLHASSTEPGAIKYYWQTNYNISKLDTSSPLVWPKTTTDYSVLIRSGSCGNFDTTTITILPICTPFAGNDITICKNYNTTLQPTNGTYFSWQPNYNISNVAIQNPVVFPEQTTTYYLTVIDTNICPRPGYDSIIVFVDTFHYAYAGNDTNVVMNIPFQLKAQGGKYYHWLPSTGLDYPTAQIPNCTLQADQTYIVKVTNENGCFAYDTVKVSVFPEVVALMPNAFTPNGDGIDDELIPIYAGFRRLDYFFIYNRWGEKVFTTNLMYEGWNGTFNHQPCEIGTYVYYISGVDATGNAFVKKGDVILLR